MVQKEEGVVKRKRGVIILAGVLVLLLVIYFALQSWNSEQEAKQEEEEEAAVVHVTQTDAEDITAISFDVGNGSIELVKEDGTWYYSPDRDFPLNQTYPEDFAEALGDITAERELVDGDELAAYGLDEPVYTVEYTDTDGNVTSIYFGDTANGDYYVTTGDTDSVYTVASSLIDDLNYQLSDMAVLDSFPSIGSGNLVKEVITQNGETTTYDSEDEEQEEDIAAIAGGLGAVDLTDAADYSVADEDLAGFGLDEASRTTVEVTYTEDDEEQLLTMYMGGSDEDGNRYVMINDSRIVYLISEEVCSNILNN